jgi:hypothetical protein
MRNALLVSILLVLVSGILGFHFYENERNVVATCDACGEYFPKEEIGVARDYVKQNHPNLTVGNDSAMGSCGPCGGRSSVIFPVKDGKELEAVIEVKEKEVLDYQTNVGEQEEKEFSSVQMR